MTYAFGRDVRDVVMTGLGVPVASGALAVYGNQADAQAGTNKLGSAAVTDGRWEYDADLAEIWVVAPGGGAPWQVKSNIGMPGPPGATTETSGKAWGSLSGALTLDAGAGVQTVTATGPLVVTLPQPSASARWLFITLYVLAGGQNVSWPSVDAPMSQPVAADFMMVSFQYVGDHWIMLPAGAGGVAATPDTTPPSQPGLKVTAFTDTTVTIAVTRGSDDESTPSFRGRYYPANATNKPDFAAVGLSGTNWQITGLTQNTNYVFEGEEVSKGGTSAVTSVSTTTAKTKGWVDSSTANFVAPDNTDAGTLKMSDGQAIVKDGSGATTILNNALTLSNDIPGVENGANGFTFPASSTLKMGRAKATYSFKAGSGANTQFRLGIKGSYPLGSVVLIVSGDGSISLDSSGSNSVWSSPVWTGATTGYDRSGTISLSVDADNKTIWAWMNGVQVGSITTTATIPGMVSARADLALWGGGGIAISNLEIMTYQN